MAAPYNPPTKNDSFTTRLALCDRYGNIVQNAVVEAGDFKVAKDGGELVNLTTTPVVTDLKDAIALLHADNAGAFVDEITRGFWTPGGNARIDTTQSKFGGASVLFDGSGDYLRTPQFATVLGTDDFTIDFWVRLNAGTSYSLFDFLNSGNEETLYTSGGPIGLYLQQVGSNVISASTTLSTGTWYHIALTRGSGNLRLFINGTQEGSTYSTAWNVLGTSIQFGLSFNMSSRPLDGWIDEIRILKGRAAWTANFTAPTRPYSPLIEVGLSASEMNADVVTIVGSDQTSPKQWADFVMTIPTTAA